MGLRPTPHKTFNKSFDQNSFCLFKSSLLKKRTRKQGSPQKLTASSKPTFEAPSFHVRPIGLRFGRQVDLTYDIVVECEQTLRVCSEQNKFCSPIDCSVRSLRSLGFVATLLNSGDFVPQSPRGVVLLFVGSLRSLAELRSAAQNSRVRSSPSYFAQCVVSFVVRSPFGLPVRGCSNPSPISFSCIVVVGLLRKRPCTWPKAMYTAVREAKRGQTGPKAGRLHTVSSRLQLKWSYCTELLRNLGP